MVILGHIQGYATFSVDFMKFGIGHWMSKLFETSIQDFKLDPSIA